MIRHLMIFGGTFDPLHKGHEIMVRTILSEILTPQDKLIIVPSYTPPLKQNNLKYSFQERTMMCQKAFSYDSRITVSRIESECPSPSYSIQTLEALSVSYPALSFSFLIGMDQFLNLDRWHHIKILLEKASFFVYPRRGCGEKDLPQVFSSFEGQFYFLKTECVPVSSTEVKEKEDDLYFVKKSLSFSTFQYLMSLNQEK